MVQMVPWTPVTGAMDAPQQASFTGLPAEIRNTIYELLLPDSEPCPGQLLRSDGQRCSTNFMAVCKQVYKEALPLLYSDHQTFYVRIGGWRSNRRTAFVRFLNEEITLTDLDNNDALFNHFLPLRQIKKLDIRISTGLHERSACEVQDITFKFLSTLYDQAHRLESLHIHINVEKADDSMYFMLSSNAAERLFNANVMREFSRISPGDFSRPHVTAFLIDPLKLIRNMPKRCHFELSYIGSRGKVWEKIPSQVKKLCQGTSPLFDYRPFHRYFDALRPLSAVFQEMHEQNDPAIRTTMESAPPLPCRRLHTTAHQSAYKFLCDARISGDVTQLRKEHHTLLRLAEDTRDACKDETKLDKMNNLLEQLDKALPPEDLDVSQLGYNESDRKLAEWQNGGRQKNLNDRKRKKAEKEEEAKRDKEQQQKEEAGHVSKKVKTDDGATV